MTAPPSDTSGHTVAAGRPLASKYAGLGRRASESVGSFDHQIGMIVGLPDSGKSFLAQSNPDGLILNGDGFKCVYPESEAVMYPIVDAEGRILDENGNPILMEWKHFLAIKDKLAALAQSGQPRPRTVYLDTVTSASSLCMHYIAKKWDKPRFLDVGQTGWVDLANEICDYATSIRQMGYGFFFVAHLSHKHIPIGESLYAEDWSVQMTDSLFKRLFPLCGIVINLSSTKIAREEKDTVEVKRPDGTTRNREVVRTITTRKVVADFANPKMEGISKSKTLTVLPSVELPSRDAWAFLRETVRQADILRS